MSPRLEGKVTDYGDLLHVERWIVKGSRPRIRVRVGRPRDTTPEDRTPTPGAYRPHDGKVDFVMDLQDDKRVTLFPGWLDEVDQETTAPADAVVTWTVDNTDVIALTDNGDGTAVAAATGQLGVANIHGEATFNGGTATGDLQVVVVPSDAVRFAIKASDPTEVTPDA